MSAHTNDHAREHGEHKATHRSYFVVFLSLMALAAVSYGLSFVSLGALGVPAAMAISLAKAVLVAMFFMELVGQRFSNRIVVVVSALMLCVLIALMVADVMTRGTPPMLTPP